MTEEKVKRETKESEAWPFKGRDKAKTTKRTLSAKDYTWAILAPTAYENATIQAIFDESYASPPAARGDSNSYTCGAICGMNVVVCLLPSGSVGQVSSAIVIADLKCSFPSVANLLIVGCGGGVPSKKNDVALADIVISNKSGVEAVDCMGSSSDTPSRRLQNLATAVVNKITLDGSPLVKYANLIGSGMGNPAIWVRPTKTSHPGSEHRDFYYLGAAEGKVVRTDEETREHKVFYGPIASGYSDMENARKRDEVAEQSGAMVFDQVSVGAITPNLPYLIIRAVSHYCDRPEKQRSPQWNLYATSVAAAFTRCLFEVAAGHS